jgi:hypothetical protein
MRSPERRAQTRDPAAFLIDHEDGIWGENAAQLSHECGELRAVLDVPREQDDAGGRVGPEQRRFLGEQLWAGDSGDGGLHFRFRGLTVDRPANGRQDPEMLKRDAHPLSLRGAKRRGNLPKSVHGQGDCFARGSR